MHSCKWLHRHGAKANQAQALALQLIVSNLRVLLPARLHFVLSFRPQYSRCALPAVMLVGMLLAGVLTCLFVFPFGSPLERGNVGQDPDNTCSDPCRCVNIVSMGFLTIVRQGASAFAH